MASSRGLKRLEILGVSLAVVFLLLYSAGIAGYVFVKKKVIEAASSALGCQITYQSYVLNPFGQVILTGVEADSVFIADKITIAFNPVVLIKQKKVRSITASGVFFNVDQLVRIKETQRSQTGPSQNEAKISPNYPDFAVEAFDLSRVQVVVAQRSYSADRLSGSMRSGGPAMDFDLTLSGVRTDFAQLDTGACHISLEQQGVFIGNITASRRKELRVKDASVAVLPDRSRIEVQLPEAEIKPGILVKKGEILYNYQKSSFRIKAVALSYDTITVKDIRISAFIRDSLLNITRCRFRFNGSPVRARASYIMDSTMAWSAWVSAPDGMWVPGVDLFFAGQVQGQGTGSQGAELSLSLDTLSYADYQLGSVAGSLSVQNWRHFSTPELRLEGSLIRGQLSGWFDLSGGFDISADVKSMQLSITKTGLEGQARGKARVRKSNGNLYFDGKVELTRCSYDKTTLKWAYVDATVAKDTLRIGLVAKGLERGDLQADSIRFEAATIGEKGGYTLFARTPENWISSEGTGWWSDSSWGLVADRLQLQLRGLGAVKADGLVLKQEGETISFSLPSGQLFFGLISFGGHLRKDSISLAVAVDSADLSAFSNAFALKDTLLGTVSCYANISGTLSNPKLDNFTLLARNLRWSFLTVDSGYGTGRLVSDSFRLDSLVLITAQDTVSLSVGFPVGWSLMPWRFKVDTSDPISGHASVSGGLAPVFGLVEKMVAFEETSAKGDVQIYNTIGHPYFSGSLEMSSSSGAIIPTGTVLSDIKAQLSMQGDVLELVFLKANTSEGGSVDVHGTIRYKHNKFDNDLLVDLVKFPIYPDPYIEAFLTGQLSVKGDFAALDVSGDLHIDEASFYAPIGQKPPPPGAERPSQMRYNIHVSGGKNIFFVNELADLEMSADLLISKEPGAKQTMSGNMEVVSGFLYFFDRSFQIEEGRLSLTHQSDMDLDMAIRGWDQVETHVADSTASYKVILTLSGKLSKPEIVLSSEPPLPASDLITLLTVGTLGSVPTGAQVGERVMNLAEGLISQELKHKINLKELEVRTGALGTGSPRFTVGLYLTRNLYFKYSRDLQEAASDYYNLRYFIKPNISVYGEKDATGVGVGFQYRFRF